MQTRSHMSCLQLLLKQSRYFEDIDLPEMDVEEVWAELEAQRASWRERGAQGSPDFTIHVRGGKWTAEHTGEATDSVRAQASGTSALSFCEQYGLNRSATFHYSAYPRETAHLLAEVWTDRMQFWFDMWVLKGMLTTTRFVLSDNTLYSTPDAAEELREQGGERTLQRLQQVLLVAPPLQRD